jgi:hypothetical protein
MKRFRVISLLILTGLCTAGISKAQNGTIRANVPFDFAVGSKLLPSGSYQFFTSSAQSNHTIFIRSADQQIIMLGMTGEDSNLPGNVTRLVFYKYGDHYFLRDIHCPTMSLNIAFPQSKLEKQTRQQMAWMGPDRVLLALN